MSRSTTATYLCLDQGGSASRALVFNAQGDRLSEARIEVAHQRPQLGRVEQDALAVVASLRDAALLAVRQLSTETRAALMACGLVCQRSSLLAWDAMTGAPLTPILSWQDVRAADWLAEQGINNEAWHAATGLYPNAHFGLSKLRWLLDHDEAVQAARDAGRLRFGPLAAFLAQSLSTEAPFLVDPVNASRTLLLDLGDADWNAARMRQFGIRREWLPGITRSDADFGPVGVDGLHLPLRLLGGDQSAAAFAFGTPRDEVAYANLGTGAFVYRPTSAPKRVPRLLCSMIHAGETPRFALEGTVNGAGSALAWLAQTFAVPDVEALLAQHWNCSPPLFLNGIGGLGAPDWRADFSSRFIGDGDTGARAVAVAESIVFLLARNLALLSTVAPPLQQVMVSGGLSASDPLCQRLADVIELPVYRPAQCEASARGSAFLLAGEPTDWHTLATREFLPRPNPLLKARHSAWQIAMEQALAGE